MKKMPIVEEHSHAEMADDGTSALADHHENHETGGLDAITALAGEVITSGTLDGDRLPAISTSKKGGVPATGAPANHYLRDDGNFQHPTQNEITNLTTGDSPVFVTVKLSGLSDGYVPYHVADATGLANSPIFTNGVSIGVNSASPAATLDVRNGDTGNPAADEYLASFYHGSTLRFRISEIGSAGLFLNDGAGNEIGRISWGTSPLGHPGIVFWTGATYDQNRFDASNAGSYFQMYFNDDGAGTGINIDKGGGYVGLGITAPTERLHVVGAIRFSGALKPNNAAGSSGNLLLSGGSASYPTWLANGLTTQWLRGGSAPSWDTPAASEITFGPDSYIEATDVQAAIEEVQADCLTRAKVTIKTDTGDPVTGDEGEICINTFDNAVKIYAEAAWRQLATW